MIICKGGEHSLKVYIKYHKTEPSVDRENIILSRTYETDIIRSNASTIDIETEHGTYDIYNHSQIIFMQIMK